MQKESLTQLGLTNEQAESVLTLHAETLKTFVPRELFEQALAQNKADAEKAVQALEAQKKEMTISMQLAQSGAKNPQLVMQVLDFEKISMEGGKLAGLDEQLESLKQTDGYLFNPHLEGREPYGSAKGSPDKGNPFSKGSFNLTGQCQLIKDNPELAAQLKAAAGN